MKVNLAELLIALAIIVFTVICWNCFYSEAWFHPEYNKHGNMLDSTWGPRLLSIIHGIVLSIIILGPCGVLDYLENIEINIPIKRKDDY